MCPNKNPFSLLTAAFGTLAPTTNLCFAYLAELRLDLHQSFWLHISQPKSVFMFKVKSDFTAKTCYLRGSKLAGWKYERAALLAEWKGSAIKHLVSSAEENMLIKPDINTGRK